MKHLLVNSILLFLTIQSSLFANSLSGVWSQADQGLILVIDEEDGKPIVESVYDYSASEKYCIVDELNSKSQKNKLTQQIVTFKSKDVIQVKPFETSFPKVYKRLPHLPEACLTPLNVTDKQVNFRVLWQFFFDYYANFDLRIGDRKQWRSLGDRYYDQITPQTSEQDLYQIMSSLLQQLHDEHIDLFYAGDFDQGMEYNLDELTRDDVMTFFQSFANSYGIDLNDMEQFNLALGQGFIQHFNLVDNEYLLVATHGPEKSLSSPGFPSQPVYTWGMLKDSPNTGYMRILQELHFEGSPIESTKEHYESAKKTVDNMMTFFAEKNIDGLIIDLRFNLGGDTAIDNYLLQYLLVEKTLVMQQQSFINGQKQTPTKFYLTPNDNPLRTSEKSFPIYVLTSNFTVSAGEDLTLELLALPDTFTVGYPTQGIFSDTHTRQLPNGWIYQLPFNKYYSFDDTCYEKIGIPPNIPIKPEKNYLNKEYLSRHQDIILDTVISKQHELDHQY